MASAAVESFQFKSADITASFTLDVIGGQAASGSGELRSPDWSGPATMNLTTLSTPNVHDLGGGVLSCRFGGGTDLIGDDAGQIDAWGHVFIVDVTPNLDVGFNVWANTDGSYTGFIAGNSPGADQPIIYLGETGALTAVPRAIYLGHDAAGASPALALRAIGRLEELPRPHKKGRSALI